MYLFFLAVCLSVSYFFLYLLFSLFFRNSFSLPTIRKAISSVVLIFILSILIDHLTLAVSDIQLSNRLLHAFGGGSLAFFVCFLVVRDAKFVIPKFQFFVFSFLVVMTLGIGNETIEYLMQTHSHYTFSSTPYDTWLDLISNSVGALIAGIILTPFIRRK
jgi:hypothetical protein